MDTLWNRICYLRCDELTSKGQVCRIKQPRARPIRLLFVALSRLYAKSN